MKIVLPDGAPLPLPYRWIRACGLRELRPWHFIDDQARALALRDEFLLEVEAPNPSSVRDWFPFASHQAQDDFAGFILHDGKPTEEVAIVHLTWKRRSELPGWPSIARYTSFWTWLTDVGIVDTAEWAERNPEDLDDFGTPEV